MNNVMSNYIANTQPLKLKKTSKEKITKYFQASWKLYEWLFSGLDQSSEYYSNCSQMFSVIACVFITATRPHSMWLN